ncbi:hypothetical protein [Pseudoxanthomonas mexicana]|uniref:hypothetical protein n=1 Tax=Pseudoxanthomonas mexicana TaxID=128785 RepID=UPI00398BB21B
MTATRLSHALLIALAGSIALVGCKRDEEPVAVTPPADTTPAPMPTDPLPPPSSPVAATSVTIGNSAAADRSVAATSTFATSDSIIVSVRTDAATPADATIDAKLTYQDGQVAGQETATVRAEDAGVTNITFRNSNPWPAGRYNVDVTVNGQPVGMTQEIEVR